MSEVRSGQACKNARDRHRGHQDPCHRGLGLKILLNYCAAHGMANNDRRVVELGGDGFNVINII